MCEADALRHKNNKIRRGFVEKTISGFSKVLIDDFYAERVACSNGLMQGLHPGVKVVTALMFIFVAACLHSWPALVLFNLWVILLTVMSSVPIIKFLKRVWLVVPLFTGAIILPSVFNIVRPGDPVIILYHIGFGHSLGPWTLPAYLAITRQGVDGAVVFILRVGACVSLSVLLTLTTRWEHLLRGFRMIRVPALFIKIMEMTYRYIYVLLHSASEMFMARKSRTVGKTSTFEKQRFVGGAMGALWARSVVLSDEIHAAMISRGYRGVPCTAVSFRVQSLDWMWAGLAVAVSIIFLLGDRLVS